MRLRQIGQGWTRIGNSGNDERWRRPGKDHGISATLKDGRLFYVFPSSAAGVESGRAYGPFGLFTALECSGDFHQAHEKLKVLGFGNSVNSVNCVNSVYAPEDWQEPIPLGLIPVLSFQLRRFRDRFKSISASLRSSLRHRLTCWPACGWRQPGWQCKRSSRSNQVAVGSNRSTSFGSVDRRTGSVITDAGGRSGNSLSSVAPKVATDTPENGCKPLITVAETDPELARVVAEWPTLSAVVKRMILAALDADRADAVPANWPVNSGRD